MNRRWIKAIKTETTTHTRIFHDTKLSEFIRFIPLCLCCHTHTQQAVKHNTLI